MLSRAKLRIREVSDSSDFQFIAELAKRERLAFDASGQETEFEAFSQCTMDKYMELRSAPYHFRVFVGIASGELAGFLVVKHHVVDAACVGVFNSLLYGVAVVREFRGSRLFRVFHDLAIELWRASGDERLISYVRAGGELERIGNRLGWKPVRVEYEYEPESSKSIESVTRIDSGSLLLGL